MRKVRNVILATVLLVAIQFAHSQECPKHKEHQRGNFAMGFDQNETVHRFKLHKDGGQIEVRARQETDAVSIHQIRTHLQEISKLFKEGDFTKPKMIHAEIPPGSIVMKDLRADIQYKYEELPNGARVNIQTENSEALRAIHDFLKFQIREHE